ncbi:MAG: hypothetical protein DKT66_11055 [Candidatus Melainabacteria bacterium]|nr:MAG: hypothetical protein DKT66_11055 [Candidatus Melainabacteria bacterium]
MQWPTPQDYNETVQSPEICFDNQELQQGAPETNAMGLPKPICGNFASVYQFQCANRNVAVKCFLRNVYNQHQRYGHLSTFTAFNHVSTLLEFEYLLKGILVNGNWYPIVKMPWVEGLTLDQFIRKNMHSKQQMDRFINQFVDLVFELERNGIAHGDLQHGNIIVRNKDLMLVDYDGIYVPAMAGEKANELGHVNYQHPQRDAEVFDETIDRFSAWIIYHSMQVLKLDPTLWQRHAGGDERLIFCAADYKNPEGSRLLNELLRHPVPDINKRAHDIKKLLTMQLHEIPEFRPAGHDRRVDKAIEVQSQTTEPRSATQQAQTSGASSSASGSFNSQTGSTIQSGPSFATGTFNSIPGSFQTPPGPAAGSFAHPQNTSSAANASNTSNYSNAQTNTNTTSNSGQSAAGSSSESYGYGYGYGDDSDYGYGAAPGSSSNSGQSGTRPGTTGQSQGKGQGQGTARPGGSGSGSGSKTGSSNNSPTAEIPWYAEATGSAPNTGAAGKHPGAGGAGAGAANSKQASSKPPDRSGGPGSVLKAAENYSKALKDYEGDDLMIPKRPSQQHTNNPLFQDLPPPTPPPQPSKASAPTPSAGPPRATSEVHVPQRFPRVSVIKDAVVLDDDAFSDPELRMGRVLSFDQWEGKNGLVLRIAGQNKHYAVKCFLRDSADRKQRYEAIARHNMKDAGKYLVSFQYQSRGLRVGEQWLPILRMGYIDGKRIDDYIRFQLRNENKHELQRIVNQFREMVMALNAAGIAHGDLEPSNILVDGRGNLRLVDYDNMYVPAIAHMQSAEVGHPLFQHPSRTMNHFGPYLDNFSALVIDSVLTCMALQPQESLWNWETFIQQLRPSNSWKRGSANTPQDAMQRAGNLIREMQKYRIDQVPTLNASR